MIPFFSLGRCNVRKKYARLSISPIVIALLLSPKLASGNELTFYDAVESAMTHDAEYRAAKSTFEASKEDIAIARSALLPQVTLSASYSYEDSTNIYTDQDSSYYDPDQPRSSGELNDTFWQLSLNQPLVDFSGRRRLKASYAGVDAAHYRFLKAEQDLVYRTTEHYLNVLYKAQLVYLNQNIHDALTLKYEQAKRKTALGVGDELESLEVEARRDLAQTDYLKAKSDLEDEQTKLNIITGLQFTPPVKWIKNAHHITPPMVNESEDEILTKALDNNDYQESVARVQQADLTQSANNALHYPTLSLGVRYSERESDDPFRDSENLVASVNFNLDLYGGGKTSAYIRQSLAQHQAQKANAESILSDTKQKISLAHARKRNISERLQALKRSAQSSQRYLDAAERGLDLNLRSQVDVLDARTQMLDVQLRLAEALNQYLLADLQLQYQIGKLSADYINFYDELFKQATL